MKKGFVLIETIVVIAVLSITLIAVYTGYSNAIIPMRNNKTYNRSEYLYKTYIVSNYLENKIDEGNYKCSNCRVYIHCAEKTTECIQKDTSDTNFQLLVNKFHIDAIYITLWDTSNFDANTYSVLEPTTVNFIKSLNPEKKENRQYEYFDEIREEPHYRIIVMYKDENDLEDGKTSYQYASTEFRTKVSSIST